MSFDINWDRLVADERIHDSIKTFLNDQLAVIALPSFIDKLLVTKFSLGNIPPEITIRHVGSPFEEFYHASNPENDDKDASRLTSMQLDGTESDSSDDENAHSMLDDIRQSLSFTAPAKDFLSRKNLDILKSLHNYRVNHVGLGSHDLEATTNFFPHNAYSQKTKYSTPARSNRGATDLQFLLEFDYKGDASLDVMVNLQVNYPSAQFISLPIKLTVSELAIHTLTSVAYLNNDIFVSVLCDLDDDTSDYFTSSTAPANRPTPKSSGGNFTDYISLNNRERIDVVKSVKIESEVGELENSVLRNVGKVEKFLREQLRTLIRDEIAWPNWICFDLNDDDADEDLDDDNEELSHNGSDDNAGDVADIVSGARADTVSSANGDANAEVCIDANSNARFDVRTDPVVERGVDVVPRDKIVGGIDGDDDEEEGENPRERYDIGVDEGDGADSRDEHEDGIEDDGVEYGDEDGDRFGNVNEIREKEKRMEEEFKK